MGRPSTKPKKLKDGFYIEVRSKGAKNGMKIRRATKEEMMISVTMYKKNKDVVVLGESKNGKWVDENGKVRKDRK